jgi:UDP-glucose 4-epimerase
MRAAVTGGAGFIGSNLVDTLIGDGAEVLIIDDLTSGSAGNVAEAMTAGAVLEQVDLRDGRRLRQVITAFAPRVVFHLAAQIDVRSSMTDPGRDASINVLGSINVFVAAVAAGVERVVNTSTGGAIYGTGARIPTPETEPARPLSAYGLSKRTAEEYGHWFRANHGLDVVTLRYGNVYGPRQDPTGDAGVIARFCSRALAAERPVVFGDGTQTRDYVYVDDIVSANVSAARAPLLHHDTYNIGTGTEVNVLELVAAVAQAAGIAQATFEPQFRPARAGEVTRSCLDVSRARRDLGLSAPTPIGVGLASTLNWMRRWAGRAAGTSR